MRKILPSTVSLLLFAAARVASFASLLPMGVFHPKGSRSSSRLTRIAPTAAAVRNNNDAILDNVNVLKLLTSAFKRLEASLAVTFPPSVVAGLRSVDTQSLTLLHQLIDELDDVQNQTTQQHQRQAFVSSTTSTCTKDLQQLRQTTQSLLERMEMVKLVPGLVLNTCSTRSTNHEKQLSSHSGTLSALQMALADCQHAVLATVEWTMVQENLIPDDWTTAQQLAVHAESIGEQTSAELEETIESTQQPQKDDDVETARQSLVEAKVTAQQTFAALEPHLPGYTATMHAVLAEREAAVLSGTTMLPVNNEGPDAAQVHELLLQLKITLHQRLDAILKESQAQTTSDRMDVEHRLRLLRSAHAQLSVLLASLPTSLGDSLLFSLQETLQVLTKSTGAKLQAVAELRTSVIPNDVDLMKDGSFTAEDPATFFREDVDPAAVQELLQTIREAIPMPAAARRELYSADLRY